MLTIKSMVLVCLNGNNIIIIIWLGLMVGSMREAGKTESNMELELILLLAEKPRMENGKKEKDFTGFKINETNF